MWDSETVAHRLADKGIWTTFAGGRFGGRLICCTEKREDGSLGGNSIWVARSEDGFLLATWTPHYYLVPRDVDLIGVICSCLGVQSSAMYAIPDDIVLQYGLTEIPIDDAERRA